MGLLHVTSHALCGYVILYTAMMGLYCSGCPDQLDLVLVVDSSGSIDTFNFNILQEFMVQVVQRFTIGPEHTRVSVVRFADDADVLWRLDSDVTSSVETLRQSLMLITHVKGKTYTSAALDQVAVEVLGNDGDREEVPNLVIVITDGKSNINTRSLKDKADVLKGMSRVMAIGVTSKIDVSELLLIASSWCDVFHVLSFDAMDDDMDSTMDQICGCKSGTIRDSTCTCTNCPPDTYQPQWAQTQCKPCPPGTVTLDQGADTCIDTCDPGQRFDLVTQSCFDCEVGSYQPNADTLVKDCEQCGWGLSTRSTGAVSQNQCEVLCDAGQRADIELVRCEDCPRGTYQPDRHSDSCIACTNSSTVTEGGTNINQCIATCLAGDMFNVTTGVCDPCPQGSYQSEDYALMCVTCDQNLTTLSTGASDVSECVSVQESVASEVQATANNAGLIAGILVAVLILIAAVFVIVFFVLRRRRNKEPPLSNLFVPPSLDKSHVYNEASLKGEIPNTSNEYDNSTPVYDTPSKTPRQLEDNGEPVYNNVTTDRVPASESTEDHVYSNTAGVMGEGGEEGGEYITENGEGGLDNPIYENQEELNTVRG